LLNPPITSVNLLLEVQRFTIRRYRCLIFKSDLLNRFAQQSYCHWIVVERLPVESARNGYSTFIWLVAANGKACPGRL
jgi:hypothetical protein